MNKKGISMIWEVILGIIFIIITFVAISYGISMFTSGLPDALESTSCATSVSLRAYALEKTGTPGSIFKESLIPSLRCKTNEFTITSKEENKIKSELADALYVCWRDMGKGQTDFIGKEVLKTKACVICSVIDFKNKGMQISGFQDYLASTVVPTKNITYLEYITNNEKINKEEIIGDAQKIDTSKKYAITYSVYSDSYIWNAISSGGGCGAIALLGGKVGGFFGTIVAPVTGGISVPVGIAVGGVLGCGIGVVKGDNAAQWIKEKIGTGKPTYAMYLQEFDADELAKTCTKVESI